MTEKIAFRLTEARDEIGMKNRLGTKNKCAFLARENPLFRSSMPFFHRRAERIPFFKYTAYGNNFVIVDETASQVLAESEKSRFADQATNMNYGIGSDNFLVIQPYRTGILEEINTVRNYWSRLPEPANADFIFRMFEPDGKEAFSCGNGLMCIANHLFLRYGINTARILTQIPTSTPKVVSIGTDLQEHLNWANMSDPGRVPSNLVHPSAITRHNDSIDMIKELPIEKVWRVDGMRCFIHERSLAVCGYLVYTGEPHMVIIAESGFSSPEVANHLFVPNPGRDSAGMLNEEKMNFSCALVDNIGNYFRREYAHLFPGGININFVKIDRANGVVEYRCFERGINRETHACGTGAVATAFVARELNLIQTDEITIWPHRCRWRDPNAEIRVKERAGDWLLYGSPALLFQGVFLNPQICKAALNRSAEPSGLAGKLGIKSIV